MTARGDATGAPREQFDIIYYVADLVFSSYYFFFIPLPDIVNMATNEADETKIQQPPLRVFRRALRH